MGSSPARHISWLRSANIFLISNKQSGECVNTIRLGYATYGRRWVQVLGIRFARAYGRCFSSYPKPNSAEVGSLMVKRFEIWVRVPPDFFRPSEFPPLALSRIHQHTTPRRRFTGAVRRSGGSTSPARPVRSLSCKIPAKRDSAPHSPKERWLNR